jgi:hypothetical protein
MIPPVGLVLPKPSRDRLIKPLSVATGDISAYTNDKGIQKRKNRIIKRVNTFKKRVYALSTGITL